MAEVELPNPEELEERRDKAFSRRVALTTAVYAVILAIASLGASNAMKHMLLAQQQSSDQWAFYQAKVIREHLYRAQALVMQAELADVAAARGPRQEKVQALATRFADEEKRYNAEKKDIEKDAKKLEQDRDHYRTRDRYFEFAEVFLQIAIVCSSVAILATSRAMFIFSMVVAALGVLSTLNGFLLFARVGVLDH
ncbi:MAG: DUF4337 domain-containing protein [Candidatus Rokuibacteriota bacterium]|nr:MAG: DUF4337 domain-containing protein [Candidatus Rokubacteria bacterium]